ncbi:hypothetical protein COPG_00036 [Colwellia phage 9A]|uniref:Uncharacterized protein n=1 Tax=Colwellia phage 9A TaxID=765765 RepID=I3UMB7_9CAUD|nr:hypothetical protein COPG_00036 [Colwellia phage 9A]AFK66632.1 hypothetical protein COPG_00036 [Colwellia phage 9A]
MRLFKGAIGINKRSINQACKMFSIDVLFGDYPYHSWMEPNGSQGTGKWWDIDVSRYTILVPNEVAEVACMFSLCHEIGHIIDHRMGAEFRTTFAREVSAWRRGYELLHLFNVEFDKAKFVCHTESCLSTYDKANKIDVYGVIRDNIINKK